MDIAFYTDSFYPELGGIQDSIATSARALAERGHRLLVVAPSASAADYRAAGLPPTEVDLGSGVRILRMPALPWPGSTGQTRLGLPGPDAWRAVSARRPDVIHVQTFLPIGRLGARHARRLNVPLVGTNHWAADAFGLYAPRRLEAALARAFMRMVVHFYQSFPAVTTPSQATADAMTNAGFDGRPMVVSNPIDTVRFRPADPASRQRLRAERGLDGPTLFYAGRLAIEKKVHVLLDAFLRLTPRYPNIRLALAGHGTYRDSLVAQARRLGIEGRLHLLGSLPHDELANWFQSSDLFVTASTSESQCMALLQAMACGLPSVVADSRALPEMLGPDAGLLAAADDADDFAQKIARLLDDPALAAGCADAAIRRADRSSITAVTEQWELLYEHRLRTQHDGDHDRDTGPQRGGLPRAVP